MRNANAIDENGRYVTTAVFIRLARESIEYDDITNLSSILLSDMYESRIILSRK